MEKNCAMFTRLLGTWIPFGLIFLSTLAVGSKTRKLPHPGFTAVGVE
jgi:hypothetical protein